MVFHYSTAGIRRRFLSGVLWKHLPSNKNEALREKCLKILLIRGVLEEGRATYEAIL